MAIPICPALRAAVALAYKYLGFIVSLVPGRLDVSLCCSDPDTVIDPISFHSIFFPLLVSVILAFKILLVSLEFEIYSLCI